MRFRTAFTLFCAGIFVLSPIRAAAASAEADWQEIIALESGPPRAQWSTREAARAAALAHLARQERALRAFISNHPADPHALDAKLRLAHLLSTRADLEGNEKARAESAAILDALARSPATPKERLADVEFAKLSLFMQRIDPAGASRQSVREGLLAKARAFEKAFPQDRRIAALLAEVSTLFDADPPQKRALLEEARQHLPPNAPEELTHRIDDDLRRIAMLGRPLAMSWTSTRGQEIDVAKLRGKVVIICFFADWSPPAMFELDRLRELAARFPARDVQALGISLDENAATLAATLRAHKLDWPVYFDGKGWESPLVRSLGINSLPTAWMLDRRGNLRTLNARAGEEEATLMQLLRER